MKPCAAIILAAGFSERMGVEKLALPFDGQHSFVSRILQSYQIFGCNSIVLVVNHRGEKAINKALAGNAAGFELAVNPFPERGRLSSLKAGLERLNQGVYAFIHNVDNPFVNQELLGKMLSLSEKADYIVPAWEGRGGHPVLLSPHVIADIKKVASDSKPLYQILSKYKRTVVEAKHANVLLNVNTPNDYQAFLKNSGLDLE
jgi:molybdenum cofactor cytidylyltransferase